MSMGSGGSLAMIGHGAHARTRRSATFSMPRRIIGCGLATAKERRAGWIKVKSLPVKYKFVVETMLSDQRYEDELDSIQKELLWFYDDKTRVKEILKAGEHAVKKEPVVG